MGQHVDRSDRFPAEHFEHYCDRPLQCGRRESLIVDFYVHPRQASWIRLPDVLRRELI